MKFKVTVESEATLYQQKVFREGTSVEDSCMDWDVTIRVGRRISGTHHQREATFMTPFLHVLASQVVMADHCVPYCGAGALIAMLVDSVVSDGPNTCVTFTNGERKINLSTNVATCQLI